MTFPTTALQQRKRDAAPPPIRAIKACVTHIWRDTTAATHPSTETGKLLNYDIDIDIADLVDGELQAEECKLVDAYVFDGHIYLAVEVEGR